MKMINQKSEQDDINPMIGGSQGIRMIEFFSGIGGMRFAMQDAIDHWNKSSDDDNIGSSTTSNRTQQDYDDNNESTVTSTTSTTSTSKSTGGTTINDRSIQSCIAYEISLYANQTYSLNFNEPLSSFKDDKRRDASATTATSGTRKNPFAIYTKLIEQLQPQDVDDVNLWTMSPPCQPFTSTRLAKQRDSADERCKGFKAIMTLLQKIDEPKRPKWILVENVKGFHGSNMLQEWYVCLRECGYTWEEYLLSPTQIGIPNNRTRYYMLAERSNRFILHDSILTAMPCQIEIDEIQLLSTFITNEGGKDYKDYMIPAEVFDMVWAKDLPIVCALDRITHCFTAAYGRQMHRATGSLLLIDSERPHSIAEEPIDRTDMTLYKGKLRRFTENELLNLFGFPSSFRFPDDLSLGHRYKLIGNSVNVKVISLLLKYLVLDG